MRRPWIATYLAVGTLACVGVVAVGRSIDREPTKVVYMGQRDVSEPTGDLVAACDGMGRDTELIADSYYGDKRIFVYTCEIKRR